MSLSTSKLGLEDYCEQYTSLTSQCILGGVQHWGIGTFCLLSSGFDGLEHGYKNKVFGTCVNNHVFLHVGDGDATLQG